MVALNLYEKYGGDLQLCELPRPPETNTAARQVVEKVAIADTIAANFGLAVKAAAVPGRDIIRPCAGGVEAGCAGSPNHAKS